MAHPQIKNFPSSQISCEVVSISHKFCHVQAEYLIDNYGSTSFPGVSQRSKVVTYAELRVIQPDDISDDNDINFIAPLFPNEVSNYIVPEF